MFNFIFRVFSTFNIFPPTPAIDKVWRDMERNPYEVDADALQSDWEAVLGPRENWYRKQYGR